MPEDVMACPYPSRADLEAAYRATELDVVAELLVRKFDAERSDEEDKP